MSITTKIDKTTFIHDGDFCGDIEVMHGGKSLVLPFSDLKGIVAEFVRSERISKLEQADADELLAL